MHSQPELACTVSLPCCTGRQHELHKHSRTDINMEKPCLWPSFPCAYLHISADIKLARQLDEVCESQLHPLPYEWYRHCHHHGIAPNAASVSALLHAANQPFQCCLLQEAKAWDYSTWKMTCQQLQLQLAKLAVFALLNACRSCWLLESQQTVSTKCQSVARHQHTAVAAASLSGMQGSTTCMVLT